MVSGLVGSFVLLRRMALVGDAMSHVALPGLALALLFSIDPFWGALAFLLAAAILIWFLELKTRLPIESVVGILFTASLALGILFIPNTEILESLFGSFTTLSTGSLILVILASLSAAAAIIVISRHLLLYTLSQELAAVNKNTKYFNLIFLLIFSLVVALGIKLVGALLMGALTIIPASVARHISRSMVFYIISSSLIGAFIAAVGILLSWYFLIIPGPVIILTGIALFGLSFLVRRI